MVKGILHIGRHKSGTTSLQRFLYNNRDYLAQHGFAYPEAYIRVCAHHKLPEIFLARRVKTLSRNILRDNILEHRKRLIQTLNDDSLVYIISSEAFQNVPPRITRQLLPPEYFQVRL